MNFMETIAIVVVISYYRNWKLTTQSKNNDRSAELLGCQNFISLLARMVATLWLSIKYIRCIIAICLCIMRFLFLVPVSPQLLTICLESFAFRSLNNVSSLVGANWCFNMSCIFVWYALNDTLDTDAEHTNETPVIYIIICKQAATYHPCIPPAMALRQWLV